MVNLKQAIALAVEAHHDQVDKAGAPYILHPLRVMFMMVGEVAQTVAVLHDVVEDSSMTFNKLQELGFSREITSALDALTHREGESYDQYIGRVAVHPLARLIKIADLEDNMDIRRIAEPGEHDFLRWKKYRRAWALLTATAG